MALGIPAVRPVHAVRSSRVEWDFDHLLHTDEGQHLSDEWANQNDLLTPIPGLVWLSVVTAVLSCIDSERVYRVVVNWHGRMLGTC